MNDLPEDIIIHIISFVIEKHLTNEVYFLQLSSKRFNDIVKKYYKIRIYKNFSEYACKWGQISILNWLKNNNYDLRCNNNSLQYAAENDHAKVFEWFENNKYDINIRHDKLISIIQKNKTTNMAKYALRKQYEMVLNYDYLTLEKLLLFSNGKFDLHHTINYANSHEDYEILNYLYDNNYFSKKNINIDSYYIGSCNLLTWYITKNITIFNYEYCYKMACYNDNIELLQLLKSLNLNYNYNFNYNSVLSKKHYHIIDYSKIRLTTNDFRHVVLSDEFIEWFENNNYDIELLNINIKNNMYYLTINVLKYLNKNGLKFPILYTKGCALTIETLEWCVRNSYEITFNNKIVETLLYDKEKDILCWFIKKRGLLYNEKIFNLTCFCGYIDILSMYKKNNYKMRFEKKIISVIINELNGKTLFDFFNWLHINDYDFVVGEMDVRSICQRNDANVLFWLTENNKIKIIDEEYLVLTNSCLIVWLIKNKYITLNRKKTYCAINHSVLNYLRDNNYNIYKEHSISMWYEYYEKDINEKRILITLLIFLGFTIFVMG